MLSRGIGANCNPVTRLWSELPTHGDIPAPRCLHAAAYLPKTNEMFVYGGIRSAGTFAEHFYLDTSLLDLNTGRWTRVDADSAPGARAGAIAFYSSTDQAVYLWGGLQMRGTLQNLDEHFIGYLTELWQYDPSNNLWRVVPVDGPVPEGREDPTYFWDPVSERLFLFHGFNKTRPFDERLVTSAYVLHLGERRWERLELNQQPEPRWRASSAFDDPITGYG